MWYWKIVLHDYYYFRFGWAAKGCEKHTKNSDNWRDNKYFLNFSVQKPPSQCPFFSSAGAVMQAKDFGRVTQSSSTDQTLSIHPFPISAAQGRRGWLSLLQPSPGQGRVIRWTSGKFSAGPHGTTNKHSRLQSHQWPTSCFPFRYLCVFGLWEEAGASGENPQSSVCVSVCVCIHFPLYVIQQKIRPILNWSNDIHLHIYIYAFFYKTLFTNIIKQYK